MASWINNGINQYQINYEWNHLNSSFDAFEAATSVDHDTWDYAHRETIMGSAKKILFLGHIERLKIGF